MSLDDVLRDPTISPSLRAALIEYHEDHGALPPPQRWDIIFGTDPASPAENRWMLL